MTLWEDDAAGRQRCGDTLTMRGYADTAGICKCCGDAGVGMVTDSVSAGHSFSGLEIRGS